MNFETRKGHIKNIIDRLIEWKHITVNELVSIDGIAGVVASELIAIENEDKERREKQQLFELLEKYFPGKLEELFASKKES